VPDQVIEKIGSADFAADNEAGARVRADHAGKAAATKQEFDGFGRGHQTRIHDLHVGLSTEFDAGLNISQNHAAARIRVDRTTNALQRVAQPDHRAQQLN